MARRVPDNPFTLSDDLWEEWQAQTPVSRAAGHREADARHELNKAKARLKVVRSEMLLTIREDPEKFDLRKRPNIKEVEAAVELTREVQKAVMDVADAEHALDIAVADKFALGVDRREALRGLTDLAHMEWRNLEPSSRVGRDMFEEQRQRSARRELDDDEGNQTRKR